MLKLGSPRDPNKRGSQVAFLFQEGYAAMQALIERGVIGDFRAPDIMRFGITPLYQRFQDIFDVVDIIHEVMTMGEWDKQEYNVQPAWS